MRVLVSALEYSANIHLKEVAKELEKEGRDIEFVGIFDKELGEPIIDLQSLAVMGLGDALKKILFFYRLGQKMAKLAKNVDKVLLIDSSGFNLPLAKKIRKLYPKKEIIYYILPQAWVWRRNRVETLEQNVDRLLSILPFEQKIYSKDANIRYVGHPLLDEIKEFKESAKEPKSIIFMPGSRRAEIKSLMPIFQQLEKEIKRPAKIVIPPYFDSKTIKELYGDLSDFEIVADAHRAIFDSDFGFICSGTATLEASLIGTPFVLSYIAKPFDYFIGKKILRLNIEYAGLANIFSKDFQDRAMHKELIQDRVTVDNLLEAFYSTDREQFIKDSKALREYLSRGSAREVAGIISNS
jgi:lipid-A-disaccharide synthase